MGRGMMQDTDSRIVRLEREVRLLKLYASGLTAALLVAATVALRPQPPEVIRARGLVIEDQAGRERILIGAPIPPAKHRVRTDLARAEKTWAARYPDPKQYMEYYKGYWHSMHGMLVLDESGFDRVAVGDSTPDPNIGKRLGPGTGIQINDQQGYERSGYSLLNVDGKNRVVLGLDTRRGEAVTLAVHDGGHAGFSAYGPGGRLVFLGNAPANDPAIGLPEALSGLLLKEGKEVKHVFNIEGGGRKTP
jgi:hypothetical protein